MFIKIKQNNQKWSIFEVNTNVEYDIHKKKLNNEDDLKKLLEKESYDTTLNLLATPIVFPTTCFRLAFRDNNNINNLILFNTECYVCNNEGKTIESIK
jgi:hypothetical protein